MFPKESGVRQAEIIAIGDEVVSGLIQDGNSRFLSERLQVVGVNVTRITAVGDDRSSIQAASREALQRVGVVIATGGLGSTHDDITKTALADLFHCGFKKDEKVAAMLAGFFKARGRQMSADVQSQSDVPDTATVLYNEKGSAPGFLFEKEGKMLFSLPGVPLEMEHLFEKYIQPRLSSPDGLKIWRRMLLTTGVSEADLWSRIGSLAPLEELASAASLPSHLGVRVRLSVLSKTGKEAGVRLNAAENLVRAKVAACIFGADDETLEGNVGGLLRQKKRTLAVAESCTGGLVGHRLTQVSGSSEYFLEGVVAYGNGAKRKRLGVEEDLLEKYGAVSREVALAMAKGIRLSAGADLGLSVTGVAGPAGGTERKPVGLTFIAVSDVDHSDCRKFIFHQDRARNKERAAQAALDLLRRRLMNY